MSTLEQLNMNINFNSTSSIAKFLTKVTKVPDIYIIVTAPFDLISTIKRWALLYLPFQALS